MGLPFARGVNELERAGLTALPSKMVKPPRIAEYKSHFECQVEWTKEWFDTRLMVVGRVVAASVDEDCIDQDGWVILDKLRPAHYCGQAYSGDNKHRFVASYQVMEVETVYDGPEASGKDRVDSEHRNTQIGEKVHGEIEVGLIVFIFFASVA